MPVYHYQGMERFSWFFQSPNVCATFLAVAVVVCLGLHLQLRRSPRRWWIGLSWSFAVLAGAGELALALTYSRGGFVALLVALAALWWLLRRRTALVFLLLAIGTSLLVSHGVSRVKSIADYGGDASLRNRLFLWRGAAGMTAETPWRGTPDAGYLYHAWRQPLWFHDDYRTMISDTLTLGTYYGVWATFLYLLAILLLIRGSVRHIRAKPPEAETVAGLCAGLVAYAVAACFSTMYEHLPLTLPLAVPLATLIVLLARALSKRKLRLRRRDILLPAAGSLLLCLGICLFGALENACLPIQWSLAEHDYAEKPGWCLHVWPRRSVRGRVLVFTDMTNDAWATQTQPAIRAWLRPLALAGYDVQCVGTDSGYGGKAVALAFLCEMLDTRDSELPFALLGCGAGAKAALLTAADEAAKDIDLVAAIDAPASWPFEGLSPDEVIAQCHGKVMLLATPARIDDAQTLAEIRRQQGLETLLVELPSNSAHATERALNRILDALIP